MKRLQQNNPGWGSVAFACSWTLAVTLLGGGLIVWLWSGDLTTNIVLLGLDPLRAQLLASLLLTIGAACLGALFGRRKGSALLGAGIVFSWTYLFGFFQIEVQPIHDPLGNLEPLNTGALFHTLLVLLALALLGAFAGAAIGCALSEVLFDPFLHTMHLLQKKAPRGETPPLWWKSLGKPRQEYTEQKKQPGMFPWLVLVVFMLLCVLAADSLNLFLYAPDVGLHSPPLVKQSKNGPQNGTIVADRVVSSALKGQIRPFLVYLPPSYNTPQGRLKRYPTLYLLHGSPGSDSDWITGGKVVQAANTLITAKKMAETILIFPDGNGRPGQTSEWGNSGDHRQNMETYVAVDLVKYVDRHYRTLATSDERGIGGLSMGGFGAMNIALHHPDIFGSVIALGGYYRAEGSIWGKNAAYVRFNSPIEMIPIEKRAWQLHFYLGAATRDQPYYTDTLQFVQELKRLHLSYHLDIQPGYHAWAVWQVQMYNALPWLPWNNQVTPIDLTPKT